MVLVYVEWTQGLFGAVGRLKIVSAGAQGVFELDSAASLFLFGELLDARNSGF
jgi:hypothetical protein